MHCYIVGITNSGKSHLAKHMARQYKAKGYGIIVLDPQLSREWQEIGDFVSPNRDEFLETFWKSKNCKVFVDECQDVMDNHDKEMHAIVKRGRHNGHQVFLISQRPSSIARNARTQCAQVISFKQNRDEALILAREFGNDDLRNVCRLGEYEFLKATSHSCEAMKI